MKRKSEYDVSELSNILYESIYSNSIRPKKKYEEAERLFSNALSSSSNTCIVFKGPTACGKGFLTASLLEKFKDSVRISQFDSIPETIDFGSHAAIIKCGNTIFPSLSFPSKNETEVSKDSKNLKSESESDQRTIVLTLSDSFFHEKSYHHIKRSIEMLRTHSGIIIFEMSDFEFEGSMNNMILKVLNETFSSNIHILNINTCTPTTVKKIFEPVTDLLLQGGIDINNVFNGDPRALFHDLYFISLRPLNPNHRKPDTLRDYRTDFFHYVGKLLYPAKSDFRIFDDISFWDINFDQFLIFLQYYFPTFSTNLAEIAKVLKYFCEYDTIPWFVSKHISMDSHYHQNATTYAPLLSCFLSVNYPNRANTSQKFFSFNRPPKIYSSSDYMKQIRKRRCKPEDFILMKNLTEK